MGQIDIGVSGVARNVVQPSIGVGGVSRSVTNGFIGVNGVARQIYKSSIVTSIYSSISATHNVDDYLYFTSYGDLCIKTYNSSSGTHHYFYIYGDFAGKTLKYTAYEGSSTTAWMRIRDSSDSTIKSIAFENSVTTHETTLPDNTSHLVIDVYGGKEENRYGYIRSMTIDGHDVLGDLKAYIVQK